MNYRELPEGFPINKIIDNKYVIVSNLGDGAMGLVYMAQEQMNSRFQMVIKTLKRSALSDEYIAKHFLQEAEALQRINHDGVVKILSHGHDSETGLPYIVMGFAEGEKLTEIINREPMAVEKCDNIVQKIARALTAAHNVGVYHRDLKPDNVIVREWSDEPDTIKLIDFGMAKVKDSYIAPSTIVRVLAGTLEYASPEQLNGEQTIEGEVFCLAVVAYQMLTGKLPFQPTSNRAFDAIEAIRSMHKRGAKSPRMLRRDLPEAIEFVFEKAFQLDSQKRYRTPIDFANALSFALTKRAAAPPVVYPPARRSIRRRDVLILITVALLMFAIYLGLKYLGT